MHAVRRAGCLAGGVGDEGDEVGLGNRDVVIRPSNRRLDDDYDEADKGRAGFAPDMQAVSSFYKMPRQPRLQQRTAHGC